MTHTRPTARRRLLSLSLLMLLAAGPALALYERRAASRAAGLTAAPLLAATAWQVSPGSTGACTQADPSCASIQSAINAASSGDVIEVAAGSYSERVTIQGKNLTVSGAGPNATTVHGGGPDGRVVNPERRVTFSVYDSTVNLSGLTITGGSNRDERGEGGGLYNSGTLTLTWCVVSGNDALRGGGVYNAGRLWLVNSTVRSNITVFSGGGIYNTGTGTLTVADSAVVKNISGGGGGGGIANLFGVVTLTGSTVSDNLAQSGGGVENFGTMTVSNSAVVNNKAGGRVIPAAIGGGILNEGTLAVTGSDVSGNWAAFSGGGIFSVSLVITDSTISNNSASRGGGLTVGGTATITNSAVTGNVAMDIGGGGAIGGGIGGGILSLGTLTISGGGVNSNSANIEGGGIHNSGTLTLSDTSVRGNDGSQRGGGLYNSLTATLLRSTVSNNSAEQGGAVHNSGSGALTAANSTLSGNRALSLGGGVDNNGTAELVNCTVYDNQSETEGGGLVNRAAAGAFKLKNSIAAGNNAPTGPDTSGAYTSQGHNLIGRGDAGTGLTNGSGGDIVGTAGAPVDARLFPLGNYGGATQTHPPRAGSPAIDAGDDSVLNNPPRLTTDQRNERARKIGAHVDIGSVEALGTESEARLFSFSLANYSVAERGGVVTITVRRAGPATQAASVDFHTADQNQAQLLPCAVTDGRASSRCDYEAASGTLLFAPGDDAKTFTVLVNDDAFVERTETLGLTLSNPAGGAALGPQSTAALAIVSDAAEGSANPLDLAPPFVRQHYHDFLNREPDTPGFNFWAGDALSCGASAACAESKRVNISGAFFFAIEFQQTGYLAYRARKAAFGDLEGKPVPLTFEEMLSDLRRLGAGVVVGRGDWEARLEQNKRDYFDALAVGARFAALYPETLSPEQFVDALNANARVALSQTERDALVSEMKGGTRTRAQALRAVAEDPDLSRAEFNKAFVLMQYFGYLRRDPDAAPDQDYTGYDFWLRKLDRAGGNFIQAEMVKAFISSTEYRNRFAQ